MAGEFGLRLQLQELLDLQKPPAPEPKPLQAPPPGANITPETAQEMGAPPPDLPMDPSLVDPGLDPAALPDLAPPDPALVAQMMAMAPQ